MPFLFCILGLFLGGLIIYLILSPKVQKTQQYNSDIEKLNNSLSTKKQDLENNIKELQIGVSSLQTKKKEIESSISSLEQQATQSGEVFLKQQLQLAKEKLDNTTRILEKAYQDAEEEYKEEYLETLKNYSKEFLNLEESNQKKLLELQTQVAEYQAKATAVAEAAKREEEKRLNIDFYRCMLTPVDIEEIAAIRSVAHILRDPEPINKVIWKVYYEKPYTDLIGRVIGSGVHCGIYKITNIENQKCYIGQAANLADRWRQHIKRGIGAEPATRNKLYPAMQEIGVENFTFEVIEECDRSLLDEREDYWQDFYKAKEFGYSIK